MIALLLTLPASGNPIGKAPAGMPSPAATATITPGDGSGRVRPDRGVEVAAGGGVLERVSVRGGGHVDGMLSADRTTWRTRWALRPGTTYTVTAVARNARGRATTVTSRFTTLHARSKFRVSDVTPMAGETVGVGMPIMVGFDRPVANPARVERALEVRATHPVEGAWHWTGSQQVIFRPKTYWPAHTTVTLVAHLAGVRVGARTYGVANSTRTFTVGESHIARVNLRSDRNRVYVDGRLTRTIPVSGGMGGADSHGNDFRTTSGVHLAMGKYPKLWFTSPNIKKGQPGYYHELVYYDVQISSTGEYLHRSPGEYHCLGDRNCSHGCVRQTPRGAAWFYKIAQRGDVIDIRGTRRHLDPANGWGFWQLTWERWLQGSAVGRPVMTTSPATITALADAPAPNTATAPPAPGHD